MSDFRIDCIGCTKCCKDVIAVITHYDARRIMKQTGLAASKFIYMVSPRRITADLDEEGWVKMDRGQRTMSLKQNENGCIFLSAKGKCTIYKARPQVCRTHPFTATLKKGKIVSIGFHHDVSNGQNPCTAEAFVADRDGTLAADTMREDREDRVFWRKCREWNRGRRKRTLGAFLEFMEI